MQISIQGVQKPLNDLQRYVEIQKNLELVAKRLCAIGQAVASSGFGGHASVSSEPIENGYRINISGEDVLFIEFGTGDSAGIHAGEYDAVPSEVRPGSWSETHAHMYEVLGFWVWHGQWFKETPPHPYTYDAYKAMVEALPTVLDEVFG